MVLSRLDRLQRHLAPAPSASRDDATNSRRDSAAEKLKGTAGEAIDEYIPMDRGTSVCVISGVGPGTGIAIARKFAAEGYKTAMLARSADRLADIEEELISKGLDAKAYACDVKDKDQVQTVVDAIRKDYGNPSIYVHNAVQAAGAGQDVLEWDEVSEGATVPPMTLAQLCTRRI